MVPLVPFGEKVLYLPLKIVRRDKGDVAKREGGWLGVIERIEEIIIGTMNGVVKCRIVTRLFESQRWDADIVTKMKGVPWEPVAGRICLQIPMDVEDHGETIELEERERIPLEEDGEHGEAETPFRRGPDKLHISRKAINKYGTTDGCPACETVKRRGNQLGRLGQHHSQECRQRVMDRMQSDPEYQQLMQRHKRMAKEANIPGADEAHSTMLDLLTEDQDNEKRHQLQHAIQCIRRQMDGKQSTIGSWLEMEMMAMLKSKVDMAEVYGPRRIAQMAKQMGLRGGWSFDLTTEDTDGRKWDLNQADMRNRAIRKVLTDRAKSNLGCLHKTIQVPDKGRPILSP